MAVPIICLMGFLVTLRFFSSPDVQDDPSYIIIYLCLGVAWLGGTTFIFPLLGLSERDDVVERCNPAATWALAGALIGVMSCFAGANIGSGPGPEVVFFCATVSTTAFFLSWFSLELTANTSEAITVDRDEGAAIRLAGFLIATGILLGGAVAGNWESTSATMRDFYTYGWPAIALLGVALPLERVLNARNRPIIRDPWQSFGISLFYILIAVAWVAKRGRP